jgi:cytochrome P450
VLAAVSQAISQTATDERMFIIRADGERARRLVRLAPVPVDFIGSAATGASVLLAPNEHSDAIRQFLGETISREIATDWNYHTPRLALDRAWLYEQLRDVKTMAPACPIYSAAAGGMIPAGAPFDAEFFAWMVSRPFLYAQAVEAALHGGFNTVVTLGPQPSNNAWIANIARAQGREVRLIDSMRVDAELQTWSEAAGALRRAKIAPPRRKPIDARTLELGAADSFEIYEALRREGPVHYLPRHRYWLVIGYEEVRSALADAERFSSDMPDLRMIDPVMLGNDSGSHAIARKVVSRYFVAEEVARRSELAEREAERLLQPLREGRELDVVTELAHPLVAAVAAELVGAEAADVLRLNEAMAEAAGDLEKLYALMSEPMATRMYGELLADGLGDDAARSVTRLMWIAGTTPQHALAPAVLLLLEHDDVRRRVQNDPSLLGAFVDESLRLHPPSFSLPRLATADIEIGGHTIRAGDRVQLGLAAANRDPARFDDPAALRLDRGANPHLSFGGGMHRCIGAPLGRGLLMAALRALFRVAPDFHAAQPLGTVRQTRGTTLREIQQLVIGA